MLNGTELGQAIDRAIKKKVSSGSIKSKSDVARHFRIKTPSVYDWIKKGSISKDKLPELWRYFSDVAGPEHWGLEAWPNSGMTTSPTNQTQRAGDYERINPLHVIQRLEGRVTPRSRDVLSRLENLALSGKLADDDWKLIESIAERFERANSD